MAKKKYSMCKTAAHMNRKHGIRYPSVFLLRSPPLEEGAPAGRQAAERLRVFHALEAGTNCRLTKA